MKDIIKFLEKEYPHDKVCKYYKDQDCQKYGDIGCKNFLNILQLELNKIDIRSYSDEEIQYVKNYFKKEFNLNFCRRCREDLRILAYIKEQEMLAKKEWREKESKIGNTTIEIDPFFMLGNPKACKRYIEEMRNKGYHVR